MKLKDVKVGMIVVDKLGNEYIVTDVDYDEDYNESEPNTMHFMVWMILFGFSNLLKKK